MNASAKRFLHEIAIGKRRDTPCAVLCRFGDFSGDRGFAVYFHGGYRVDAYAKCRGLVLVQG